MADKNNLVHVSPGIYTSESVDLKTAANSVGVTKLALVGETLKGPAFQPYWVKNFREYQTTFGGTSTEKFPGSGYVKYELPYIAQQYLQESDQLCVVRTLGFSGYNAGPAWVITGQRDDEDERYVIAVLRSRGSYKYRPEYAKTSSGGCECQSAYDSLVFNVGETSTVGSCSDAKTYQMEAVLLNNYTSLNVNGSSCTDYSLSGTTGGFAVSATDLGRFTINVYAGNTRLNRPEGNSSVPMVMAINTTETGETSDSGELLYGTKLYTIPVSLNKGDKDYILNVLGTSNEDSEIPFFVESLFDVAWQNAVVNEGFNKISSTLVTYAPAFIGDYSGLESVTGILTKNEKELTSKDLGKRYLYTTKLENASPSGVTCYEFDYKTGEKATSATCKEAYIYTVAKLTESNNTSYVYKTYQPSSFSGETGIDKISIEDKLVSLSSTEKNKRGSIVYNYEDGLYYKNDGKNVVPIECDLNDYKSSFRYSSTPWVVSNVKGDASAININRLFRFHTISDGATSVDEVKVSIENIRPDSGQFDVVVRAWYDNDSNPNVLERYTKCTMTPGDNYVAYKIGTFDGTYESKSKYITIEVIESSASRNSVPAGFMGYPIPNYNGACISNESHSGATLPPMQYNKSYDEDIKPKKQYFGISDLAGYDIDYFTYKGQMATLEDAGFTTHGFHLDCRMNSASYAGNGPKISVDGDEGYIFDTVSVNERTTSLTGSPIIATEESMATSIYSMLSLRKFTLVFYGGFDGWDIYRSARTNTDEFSATKYKGFVDTKSGAGYAFDSFNKANDIANYNIEENAITSDYYSTLAGISLLKNPEEVDINLLATPGIDTINNTKLVKEAIDIVENRADTLYIATTPDKEYGAGDFTGDIADTDVIISDFVDKDINSNYVCTYYPWIKVEDNNEYIWLPPTKDVVRNMAESDNGNTTMNLAPAGTSRGRVNGIRARKNLKNDECDALYAANINPIRTFAQEGMVIFGQKNLQLDESPLNRIDVRRTLLRMRKLIAIGCLGLIFEPNDNSTKKSFESIVKGILQGFVNNRAISNYKLEVDDSEEARDRRELPAKIWIKPIKALEYITVDFVVTDNGAYFTD